MEFIKKLLGIKTIAWASYEEEILTITYTDNTQDKYCGGCTVWHKWPMMKRCSTSTENQLCDIWTYIKQFGNNYPDAHKKIKG